MNVNVKEKLKTLSVSDSGIDSIMEIMDLPDKQFDAMFPELKKAIGEIYDDEIAVEKTLNDMRKLNVSRTQFMQEAEQLKTLINDIENDNALSKNKKELLTTVLYEAVKLTEMAIENPRERIVVKYVKVNENAKIPTYAHDSDAGADIYAHAAGGCTA